MARRNNVLNNPRGPRNSGLARNNPRNRTRNRNSVVNRNENNRRPVRRVFKNRNFKGGSGGLRRRNFSNNQNENEGGGNNNRRGRFRRNRRSFTFRRFNRSYRNKQNFKKNKDAKTADQMDMELDTYMGGEAQKARLDADLTSYFSQPESTNEKQ